MSKWAKIDDEKLSEWMHDENVRQVERHLRLIDRRGRREAQERLRRGRYQFPRVQVKRAVDWGKVALALASMMLLLQCWTERGQ